MTRQSDARQLTHVITVLCDRQDTGPLRRALDRENYTSIDNILYMPQAELKELEYVDDDGNIMGVPKGDIGILNILRDFAAHRRATSSPITDWTDITADEFLTFRMSTYGTIASGGRASLEGDRGQTDPTATAIKDFDKSVKRDPESFPLLQDGKNWNKWWSDFQYEAHAQGLENMLDGDYVPQTASEVTLFEKQSKYMTSVLNKKLKSDKGKEIIRAHKGKAFQAQLVIKDIQEYGQKSTSAKSNARRILKLLMDARVNSPTVRWKGGTAGFVRYWKEQCDQYEELKEQPMDEDSKLTMLQNAVRPIPDLNAITTQSAISGALDKDKQVTFAQYYELLEAAAEQYDEEHGKSTTKGRRQVFLHDIGEHDEDVYAVEQGYDGYEANRTGMMRAKGFMPGSAWRALSEEQRELWLSLPDNVRETILNARSPSKETSANLHDISAEDYIQSLQVNLTDMSGHDLITAMRHEQGDEKGVTWADANETTTQDQDGGKAGSERVAAKTTFTPRSSPASVLNVLSHNTSKKAAGVTKPKPDIKTTTPVTTCEVMHQGKKLTLALLPDKGA